MKKSIVGTGRADKEQVAFMVGKILNIKTANFKLDTTDALGIAICHSSMRKYKQLEELHNKK
jgi:crossover junction endodeoxyribonuclease RuvC